VVAQQVVHLRWLRVFGQPMGGGGGVEEGEAEVDSSDLTPVPSPQRRGEPLGWRSPFPLREEGWGVRSCHDCHPHRLIRKPPRPACAAQLEAHLWVELAVVRDKE